MKKKKDKPRYNMWQNSGFCDRIQVFDSGSIVQDGSHEQLLADEAGNYAQLWNAQAQYYAEKGIEVGA